jgi:Ca-activated chloride channel family protein
MNRSLLALVGAVTLIAARPEAVARSVVSSDVAVSIVGQVTDASNGSAVQAAQVHIEGTSLGTLTSASGEYVLLLDDGWIGREVAVNVTYIGYAATQARVTLAAGANTLDFALTVQVLNLDGLAVEAVQGRARRREASMDATRGGFQAASRAAAEANRIAADRESYAHITENGFVGVVDNPLSTFSIDVDRASYSNVRRFIRDGKRPPIDAVRIEELINYFTYSDPAPAMGDDVPLFVSPEIAPAPWQPLHYLVRIAVKARAIDLAEAPANNLVFLLDVSGSMNRPDKLPLLKQAFSMLVDELRPRDRVAIVVYAGAAGLVLPSTPGSEKETILDALEQLRAGGSTAGGAGISLAYAVAAENFIEDGNNRVILATDGDFNVGASSDSEMVRLIEEKREQGTYLSVLGFGTGNLQDAKVEQIADHGNGNYAYIDSQLEARKVLVTEMGGTLVTVAQDVKIQVEFNPARVAAYRLIGYENRLLANEDFNDDTKDAGELGAGHSVIALYEIVPVGVDSPVLIQDVDDLRYQRNPIRPDLVESEELLFVKLRYQEPGGSASKLVTRAVGSIEWETSDDFRFAASVAAWGMLLRGSEHCQDFTLDDVARLARGALGEDAEGYRAEFLTLVDRARSLELLADEPGGR